MWKALKRDAGNGAWKQIHREAGSGWKALEWEDAYLYEDNFEYADNAALHAVWTDLFGTSALNTTYKHSGAKSVYTNECWTARTITTGNVFYVEIWAYFPYSGDKLNLVIDDSSNRTAAYLDSGYPTSGKYGYLDSTGWNASGVDAITSTWHKIKIKIDKANNKFWIWVDDVAICLNKTFNNISSTANRFKPGYNITYYDDLVIGNY